MGITVNVCTPSALKEFNGEIMFLDELQQYKERYGFL